MEQPAKIGTLLAANLKGNATEAESRELEQLLRAYPALGYYVKILVDRWEAGGRRNEQEIEQAFRTLCQRMFEQGQPPASTPLVSSGKPMQPAPGIRGYLSRLFPPMA
ncbi:MAG TPA: hypothetical protein VG870_06405 [Chitinophagaceae bacterium]|nr:hypothetical protein [Chitinophagaceae bacterium]